ncbi:MAG: discoidin domain-containing protein, partial [Muribaculaceae bacterium]|nr:discoidin domain-containing protein [Muribaculaceae bacterium]
KGAVLDILVEAMGRINFGRAIKDFKGIVGNVTVTVDKEGHPFVCDLKDWKVYNLPDCYDFYKGLTFKPIENGKELPRGVYRATFTVKKPGDTFLNFETFGKGLVYVNGRPMGRIWEIGPQQTLYMPGVWLNKGENEVLVFDIEGPRDAVSEGLAQPIVDKLPHKRRQGGGTAPDLTKLTPAIATAFEPGTGWQEKQFGANVKGRYLVIEAVSGHKGDEAAIAEFYAIDDKGNRISREGWNVEYASSEDTDGVNRTGDKVFDLQESTYWQTAAGAKFPHVLVIDLGRAYNLSAVQYLPRMEPSAPGAIKDFRIYVASELPAKK